MTLQNEPQLSVELADGVMEIIDRHGENTSEGGIYWNKQLGWDKKGSTAYNAEEECKKEVQSFLATALEEQKKKAVLDYIMSLGWQDDSSEYVKEVLADAEKLASELTQKKEDR